VDLYKRDSRIRECVCVNGCTKESEKNISLEVSEFELDQYFHLL